MSNSPERTEMFEQSISDVDTSYVCQCEASQIREFCKDCIL